MSIVGQGISAPLKLAGGTPEAHTGIRSKTSTSQPLEIEHATRRKSQSGQGSTGTPWCRTARDWLPCHADHEATCQPTVEFEDRACSDAGYLSARNNCKLGLTHGNPTYGRAIHAIRCGMNILFRALLRAAARRFVRQTCKRARRVGEV